MAIASRQSPIGNVPPLLRYTEFVRRSLHVAVSLVLLAVLSGAPAVALLCAEWCAPTVGLGHADHSAHVDHVMPSGASAMDCHGAVADSGAIHALDESNCTDHGAAITRIAGWLIASRIDTVHPMASAWTSPVFAATTGSIRGFSLGATHAPPARPVTSSLALRI